MFFIFIIKFVLLLCLDVVVFLLCVSFWYNFRSFCTVVWSLDEEEQNVQRKQWLLLPQCFVCCWSFSTVWATRMVSRSERCWRPTLDVSLPCCLARRRSVGTTCLVENYKMLKWKLLGAYDNNNRELSHSTNLSVELEVSTPAHTFLYDPDVQRWICGKAFPFLVSGASVSSKSE